jgi:uncharacterized protein (DUF1330 family)
MPAYIVAMISVTDPDQYRHYAELAGPATARYGGRFLVRGGPTEVLEGRFPFTRLVITEFPSREQAKQFYASPEYQEARKKRLLAADFDMVVADGVPP